MALMEYFRYDGIEIFNSLRIKEYAKNMGLGFFKCDDVCDGLQRFLEVQGWKDPLNPYILPSDQSNRAPWHDGAVPVSDEFGGAHLLDISNIASSTRTGSSSEYIGDGGWVQGSRRTSREMVFRALLIGSTFEGARYGLTWLSTVLEGGDVCSHVRRVRNTYSDISFGWILYKRDQVELIPDNIFQANPATPVELGGPCATGIEAFEGNTYANLRDCAMPKYFPLELDEGSIYANRDGLGQTLDFLIDCPEQGKYGQTKRHIEDCTLLSGPTILSERVIGGDCQVGAWVEVEFTILGGNPGVWWDPRSVLTTEASGMSYGDFLPCGRSPNFSDVERIWTMYKSETLPVADNNVFQANEFNGHATGPTAAEGNTYGTLFAETMPDVVVNDECTGTWIMYKGGEPLPVDDDLFDAPLAVHRPQTYGGLLGALFDRISFLGKSGALVIGKQSSPPMVASRGNVLVDPSCPVPVGFPEPPGDAEFCPPPYSGTMNRFRYEIDTPTLPKFVPTAITTTLQATEEVRNLVVTFIPQLGKADPAKFLSFRVSWLPADSLMIIDGVNRRADVLLNYTQAEAQQSWHRADHLIFREDNSFAYNYPEVVCGARSVIFFDIPDIYDPFTPNFGLVTTSRDV